jgi:hypothetical protein
MGSEFGVRTVIACLIPFSVWSAELEGVKLDDRVHVDGQALELNGMALRTRYYFKVYVAGLYLPAKVTSASRAIDGDGAKRIVLVMMRDATADQFCESLDIGLSINHTPEELERIRPQTEQLFSKIRAIGEARQGTRIVLDFAPSKQSTTLVVDGVQQGAPMAGAEFFRSLLRIWLGERPAQTDLKRLLLGVDP